MAITITNLGASSGGTATAPDYESGVDAASYSNASWTPPTTGLILLWVYNTRTTSLGSAGTVTGNSLTWLNLGSDGADAGSQTHRCTLYAAKAAGATTGQTTVSFAGDTQSSIAMCFVHVLGADTTGTTLNAFQQTTTNNSAGATSLTVTLAVATSTANRFIAGIGHGEPEAHTAEAGWTPIDEVYGTTPGHGILTMWHASSTSDRTPTVSWTTSRGCAGVATEVKELASNETFSQSDTVGLTDSIARQDDFVKTQSDTVGLTDALTASVGFIKTLSDTVGLTDAITKTVGFIRTISDTVGLTDLVEYLLTLAPPDNWEVNILDTVGLTDTVSKVTNYIRSIANTVGITTSVIGEIEHFGREFLDGVRRLYVSLRGKRNKSDNTLKGNTE